MQSPLLGIFGQKITENGYIKDRFINLLLSSIR